MTGGGSLYDSIRSSVNETGTDARVEVNQRALIDKILARYASANAVYRELIQNSNDANATAAEIIFTTADGLSDPTVTQVVYRNNGMPFRPQDWSRLQKIAEGNPDVSKIGAFGVGAYTMFSICEEPLVVSGKAALAFLWKGDALWTKTAINTQPDSEWTSFILPSRDPYPLPDLAEFGKFLCSSLTFTKSLAEIRVIVNDKKRMVITKTQIQGPTVVTPPKSSSWWKNDGAVTASPRGLFTLASDKSSILETMYHIQVSLDGETASIRARYVSGIAKTRIPPDMARRMERVTKKNPPAEVTVDIFINGQEDDTTNHSKASQIVQSFSPQQGAGRIFIGFRTSQTTGLAAHLSAPFVPTVEREAMDLQDPTLCIFNTEMLEFCGILMRLTLEHTMNMVGVEWQKNEAERLALERKLEAEQQGQTTSSTSSGEPAKRAESQDDDDETVDGTISGSLMGFARFMAKGVKKKIVNVLSTVQSYVVEDGANQLNPPDPRPLSAEERQAILLMRSFCPQQSTPDPMVGFALAQGFSRCLPNMAPPVLTKSGVVRGDQARLCHQGIEAFVQTNVIRKVVYQNAEQYHDVIARCRRLNLDDLVETLTTQVLDEKHFVNFLKWWMKYSRVDSAGTMARASLFRSIVRFTPDGEKETEVVTVLELKNIPYYLDKEKMAINAKLPMPEVVMTRPLQEKIGLPVLGDVALKAWFEPLPLEVWAEFVSRHPIMTAGQPEDEPIRIQILLMLSNEYSQRVPSERVIFGSFCQSLFGDKRCLPFDSLEPSKFAADCPSDLYLYSAELKAFDAIGSFHKVSQSLKNAGLTEEFLLALGVRKSVSIDLLFSNLDTLRWSDDPRPLIEYLRSASLTHQDVSKLKSTQYLPAENDISRTFAPSELYFPDHALRIFPFVRLLQWPSEDELTERTANGKFLVQLGMMVNPPLLELLQYIANDVRDDQMRIQCLDYVCKYMGPNGVYQREYGRIRSISQLRFLPCVWKSPLDGSQSRDLHSPVSCYSNASCGVLGVPVLDPKLEASGKLYGSLFNCASEPTPDILVRQLLHVVASAKNKLQGIKDPSEQKQISDKILAAMKDIFTYLSSRSTEFKSGSISALATERFIPCVSDGILAWYKPDEVFFQNSNGSGDSLTAELFRVVEFSPFLASAGVKQEATTQDLFRLLIVQPQQVLKTLGSEAKYRQLLRRIAANPPFRQATNQIRSAPFLLAYRITEGDAGESTEEKSNYLLAKAEDIYIIDNSIFGRMFKVNRAPHESDLEDFYSRLGSPYISKRVEKNFEVMGRLVNNTDLTQALSERIRERTPLLVSPGVTSRPLLSGAATILGEKNLIISEASDLKAVYSLGNAVRRQRITCCPNALGGRRNALYVTRDFDWFDVAYAIGGLILERCELENAFLISSLLEAPLEQLRARGFPVDRVVKLEPLPEPTPPPPPAPPVVQSMVAGNQSGVQANVDPRTGVGADPGIKSAAAAKIPPQPGPTLAQLPPEPKSKEAEVPKVEEGFPAILHQMFPDCSKEFIKEKLGDKPDLNKVQELAEQLSMGKYPRNETKADKAKDHAEPPPSSPDSDSPLKKKKSGLGKKLGRAFGGLRGSQFGGAAGPSPAIQTAAAASAAGVGVGPPKPGSKPGSGNEALTQDALEQQLQHAVKTSTSVDSRGVNSTETLLTNIPEGLDRGSTCEVLPGHTLMPFPGPHRNGKAHNGIRVFSARNDPKTAEFLDEQYHAVDSFADVIQNLAQVFGVELTSVAIFHDFDGGAIAFNSNRSMFFNLRFFYLLHYARGGPSSRGCYSYWYVTFSHELAHHFVGNHNKEHGFYTECFTMTYLPKLMTLLERIERQGS